MARRDKQRNQSKPVRVQPSARREDESGGADTVAEPWPKICPICNGEPLERQRKCFVPEHLLLVFCDANHEPAFRGSGTYYFVGCERCKSTGTVIE